MKNEDGKYKMNRSVTSTSSFIEADNHVSYWMDKTPEERLNAACFIINNIYGVTPQTKIRKDIITARKHK